jgi:Tfp pilus assembly protein PilN
MKAMVVIVVCAFVVVASTLALVWQVDTRERRIVQLECALAQAHAEADTLEAILGEDTDGR